MFSSGEFFSRVELPTNFFMLVFYGVWFHVPILIQVLPMETQPLEFVPSQPFGVYPWQAHVPPDADPWPMPGVLKWLLFPTVLSRGVSCYWAVFQPSNHYGVAYSLGGWTESHPIPVPSLHGYFPPLMKQSSPGLWWVLNLVIPV